MHTKHYALTSEFAIGTAGHLHDATHDEAIYVYINLYTKYLLYKYHRPCVICYTLAISILQRFAQHSADADLYTAAEVTL